MTEATQTTTRQAPFKEADFGAKRDFFDSGSTLAPGFRISMLHLLKSALKQYEPKIAQALYADLGKSEAESYITEISVVYEEIDHTLAHIKEWMKPEARRTPLVLQPSSSKIVYVPKGVVLIVSPWNYPFQLAFAPLVGAMAAGNCAVVKPSEMTPHVASVTEELIRLTFPSNYISVVQGSGEVVVPALLEKHVFNHIFFTGSPAVGSIIAGMAAKTLTSTTLELGGKSPGIVDASANLKVAAHRLVWGKYINVGQTCVAPDYLLVHEDVKDRFLKEVSGALKEFYGDDPKTSPDYSKIINEKRFDKLIAYLSDGEIIYGGASDRAERYIAPTIIEPFSMETPVMRDEIFGPVWPLLTWRTQEDLLRITRQNRYPLACYYFGESKETEAFVLDRIEFGGGCVNNAVVQFGNNDLPFGGVQGSGYGHYHGWHSFACFSNPKSLLKTSTLLDPSLKYPPYGPTKLKWLKRLLG